MVRRAVLSFALMFMFLLSTFTPDAQGGSVLVESEFFEGIHDNTTDKNGLRLDFGDRTGEWTLAGSSPGARILSAMAYSSSDDLAILFGGEDQTGKLLQDTWQLMDGRWMPIYPEHSPCPREGHSMVYIGSTDEILLFGGRDRSYNYSDLIRFNLTSGDWSAVYTNVQPGARAFHQMVYDPDDDVALLLGGLISENKRVWAYHPKESRWEAIEPKEGHSTPSMGVGVSATYIGDGRVLMFGGSPYGNWETDFCWVYHYRTNTWTKVTTNMFPNAIGEPGVYIPDRNEVMFWGHYTRDVNTHTWLLNLTTMQWSSPVLDFEPRHQGYYAISYFQALKSVVMMGGGLSGFYGYAGYPPPDSPTTWLYHVEEQTWTKLRPTALSTVVHVPSPDGAIITYWEAWRRGLGDEWTSNGSNTEYGRDGAAAVFIPDTEEVLYFGGKGPFPSMGRNGPYNHTAKFSTQNMTWYYNQTPAPPPARMGHTLVYDDVNQDVIMFGGDERNYRPPTFLGDTWSFDAISGTWSDISPSFSPTPRAEHVMVQIPGTGEAMLFGGMIRKDMTNGSVTDDTWIYNRSENAWRNITDKVRPSARYGAAAAFCPTLGGVLLFGGRETIDGSFIELADTWLFYPENGTWVKLSLSGPSPRYDAQMVYDSTTGSMLLLGGKGQSLYGWSYDLWALFEPVFLSNGTYTSQVFDLGGEAHFGDIILEHSPALRSPSDTDWDPDKDVTVRLRTGSSVDELEREAFRGNYTGSSRIDPFHNGSRFIQFEVELSTGDTRGSPRLDSLEIRYNLMHGIRCTVEEGGNWSGVQNITWVGWDLDGDQLLYDVYISNGTDWDLVISEVSDGWFEFNTSGVENGDHLIKIIARDDNVSIPLVNETISGPFKIANVHDRPPTAWMIDPPDGATLSTDDVILSWGGEDPDGDPIVFHLQITTPEGGMGPLIIDDDLTAYRSAIKLPEGQYCWTVIPRGGTCISGIWSFNVSSEEPPEPVPNRAPECTLVSPADGDELKTGTLVLSWEASDPDDDILNFTVHINHLPLDGTGPIIEDHSTIISQIALDISPGWTLWWVTANDGELSTDSAQWNFFIPGDDQPPNEVPSIWLLGPNDGITLREGTLTFEWMSSDEEGDDLVFHLYISGDREDVKHLIGERHTTMENSLSLPLEEGRYYWTVVVEDGGSMTVAGIRSFDVFPDLDVIIDEPTEGVVLSGVLDVSGRVDNVIGDVVVMVRVDGGDWQVAHGGRTWTVTLETSALGEGPHEIEVLAVEGVDEDEATVNIRVAPKMQEFDDSFPWALVITIAVIAGVALVIREKVLKRNV